MCHLSHQYLNIVAVNTSIDGAGSSVEGERPLMNNRSHVKVSERVRAGLAVIENIPQYRIFQHDREYAAL